MQGVIYCPHPPLLWHKPVGRFLRLLQVGPKLAITVQIANRLFLFDMWIYYELVVR